MRIATWNVEWFSSLFDVDDRLLVDDEWSGRQNVTRAQQVESIAKVMVALDADALMVIEAPNTGNGQSSVRALENFAAAFGLRTGRALGGFPTETQQEITLMYDPRVCTGRHDPIGKPGAAAVDQEAPRFDGTFHIDLDIDRLNEAIRFSKPPLEVDFHPLGGPPVRLIGVHAKSKAPHGARTLAEQIRISIDNRRKQLAQCIWIRARVEYHLKRGDSLIVLGDFNDGPGLDEYERLFGHSGVEIVMGCDGDESMMLFDPNARRAMSPRSSGRPATARFFIPEHGTYLNALLDYVMVSPDLRKRARGWRIWHPFDDPDCFADAELREALLTASDHFPVSVDLDIPGSDTT